jgi:hypothetical protein
MSSWRWADGKIMMESKQERSERVGSTTAAPHTPLAKAWMKPAMNQYLSDGDLPLENSDNAM